MQKRKKLTRLVTCEVLLAAGRSHPLDVLPLRIVELLHLDVVLVPLPLPCELQLYPDTNSAFVTSKSIMSSLICRIFSLMGLMSTVSLNDVLLSRG